MTEYDRLAILRRKLCQIRFLCTGLPAIGLVAIGVALVPWPHLWVYGALVAVASTFVFAVAISIVLKTTSSAFRDRENEIAHLNARIHDLRNRVIQLCQQYPSRIKGQHFKTAYALNGRSVRDFEMAMAIGMKNEKKEVFVTAFVRQNEVVRVTASIGSPFRCSAADDPRKWPIHYRRLKCDDLRQYHNHPAFGNHTIPSPTDYRSNELLNTLLEPAGISMKAYIVYWNEIFEWRLLRYDENEGSKTEYEFDISAFSSAA
jgi:hypothetical protein